MNFGIASHQKVSIVKRVDGSNIEIIITNASHLRDMYGYKANYRNVQAVINRLNKTNVRGVFSLICNINVPVSKVKVGDTIALKQGEDVLSAIKNKFGIDLDIFALKFKDSL